MVFRSGKCLEVHKLETPQPDDVLAMADACNVEGGIYCSVGQIDVKLIESLRCLMPDEFMVLTHKTAVPLQIDYRPAEALGLDRVAAMVGALQKDMKHPLLVADAGTAITADLLLPDGRFAGGTIAPGIRLRLQSLHAHTARLPQIELRESVSPAWGSSTRESMLSGCVWGAAMELAARFRFLKHTYGDAELVLTGGDAGLIAEIMGKIDPGFRLQMVPELVGIGLDRIYEFNKNTRN